MENINSCFCLLPVEEGVIRMHQKIFAVLNTKLNKLLLFESFIMSCMFLLNLISGKNDSLYKIGIADVVFIYIVLVVKLFRRRDISIIEIFLSLFFLYVIGTYIFFNNSDFQNLILKLFVSSLPCVSKIELIILNTILFFFTKVLMLPFCDIRIYFDSNFKTQFSATNKFNTIVYFVIAIFLPFLIYGIKSYSNYNDALENSGPMFSIIAYLSFVLSIFTIMTDQGFLWNKHLLRSIFIIICALLIAKIGSRTYAMYLLFSLLINLKKRGLKFGNKPVLIVLVLFTFLILYQSIARIGMHGVKDVFSILVLFGEFFLPAYSFYYFVHNPLNKISYFCCTDFIFKFLPASIVPELKIDSFMSYYAKEGIQVAPVGGLFLYGQLFYYAGIFSFFFIIVFSIYMLYLKKLIELKGISLQDFFTPIIFLIIPRQLLYLIPRTILLIFIFYIIINSFFYKNKIIKMENYQ